MAGGRLDRNDLDVGTVDLLEHERKGKTGKVASPPGASDDDIGGLLPGQGQLFSGFLTDDRLVQQDMVQDPAQ